MSYLAQTRNFVPVILNTPECVEGAADADSQLSFLGHCPGPIETCEATTSSQTAFFIRV